MAPFTATIARRWKAGDADSQARLNRRLAPFILRRIKAQVATELPPKTEITHRVVLHGRQRLLCNSLRLSLADELRQVVAERRIAHSGQGKPVFVFRLITAGTVEKRINAMKQRKAAVLEGGGSCARLRFDQSALDALLAPG